MASKLSASDREIRLGLWKIHILHHAAKQAVWGLWLLEELAEHGHKLSPGTLYPALARMEENGWIAPTSPAAGPRARRSFRITADGLRLLEALRHDIRELYDEVVVDRPRRPKIAGGATTKKQAPSGSRDRGVR
ncbi:MAG: helix-turn-helix transcriptional regulator [Polyangiaceae bacterium]|nr:helix-turn-helix transcriptional regulator [Polyangiaceae bacterium]